MKLFADDGAVLEELALKVAADLATIRGVVDVNPGITPAGDALVVRVDRDRAALEGVEPDALASSLSDLVAGNVTTGIARGEKVVNVRVWIPENARDGVWNLDHLLLHAPDGHRFPVSRIASVTRVSGQPQINRDDLKRMAAVTGRISGRDLGSTIRDVRALLDGKEVLPPGVYYELGGLYEQQQIAFRGLLAVLAAAVVLVFLVLLLLYERFAVAVAVLLTTGLAFGAVCIGLWVTGTELDISAMMGLTMIVGIVTEVSIFYVTETRELAATLDDPRRLLVEAGKNRMRPIAMTTLAAFFALLPLALGIGEGSGMLRPLAIAIDAGLIAQLPLVLLILPVLIQLLSRRGGEATVMSGAAASR